MDRDHDSDDEQATTHHGGRTVELRPMQMTTDTAPSAPLSITNERFIVNRASSFSSFPLSLRFETYSDIWLWAMAAATELSSESVSNKHSREPKEQVRRRKIVRRQERQLDGREGNYQSSSSGSQCGSICCERRSYGEWTCFPPRLD
jgi:hypothetical protein